MTGTVIPFKAPQKAAGVPLVLGRGGERVKSAWLLHDLAKTFGIDLRLAVEITKGNRPPEAGTGK